MEKMNGARNGSANDTISYRELLLIKQAELLAGFRPKLDMLVKPGSPASDDLAQRLHDQHVAIQLNLIDALQLQLVTTALQRLDGDHYGVCTDCGEPIADQRLRAVPWTDRCIRCQERLGSSQTSSHNQSRNA